MAACLAWPIDCRHLPVAVLVFYDVSTSAEGQVISDDLRTCLFPGQQHVTKKSPASIARERLLWLKTQERVMQQWSITI